MFKTNGTKTFVFFMFQIYWRKQGNFDVTKIKTNKLLNNLK